MARNELLHSDLDRRALELMPWYVNGTLEGEERELVSRRLLESLTCRKEFERLRRLQHLIRQQDAEAVATDRAFERLLARIDASDRSRARRRQWSRFARFALAASVVAAIAAPIVWWDLAPSTGTRIYETLSRPQPADAAGARLRVVFEGHVPESERRALLARHGLTVVGSPTPDGIVTLAMPERADQAAIVAALERDPRIALVTSPPPEYAP